MEALARNGLMRYEFSVCIRSFSSLYFPAFGLNTERYGERKSPNAGKYGPEKLRIRTLFTQCPCSKYQRYVSHKLNQ